MRNYCRVGGPVAGLVCRVGIIPALLLSFDLCGEASAPAQLAPIIHAQDARVSAPLWVDAEAAVDSGGRLRRELFPFKWEGMLREFGDKSAGRQSIVPTVTNLSDDDRCNSVIGGITGDSERGNHRPQSLEELADAAGAIYVGTVVAIRPGFLQDLPASLLETDSTVLRSFDGDASPAMKRVHLVYQYARFAVGEVVACSGLRPIQTGDRFVAFVANKPQDTDGALTIPDDLFIETSTGGVSSNEHWMSLLRRAREDAPRLDTVIEAARRSELKRVRARDNRSTARKD